MLNGKIRWVVVETVPIVLGLVLMLGLFSAVVWKGWPPALLIVMVLGATAWRAISASRAFESRAPGRRGPRQT